MWRFASRTGAQNSNQFAASRVAADDHYYEQQEIDAMALIAKCSSCCRRCSSSLSERGLFQLAG
jgi:hypothetical protein